MENTISLEALYYEVQEILEKANMGTWSHSVSAELAGYYHIKEGIHGPATILPKKEIRVWIGKNGESSISATHWSVEVVMTIIKAEIAKAQSVKLAGESAKKIDDITIQA